MPAHALDNPVWYSLRTQHAGLAITADGAARYPPAVAPFAAVDDPPGRAANQLASLIDDDESVYLVGVAPEAPSGWQVEPKKPIMSAVCTHPDYTGCGYAQRLLALLCNSAFDRGFTPFLHVYADNSRAIGVYRKLAFVDRTMLPLWALHR